MRTIILCASVSGDVDEFTSAIQSFMETSMLGEYESRLKLITSFQSDMIGKGISCSSSHIIMQIFSQSVILLLHGTVEFYAGT